jgi:hypothetical protein
MEQSQENEYPLLRIIYRWRKPLIVFTIVAAAASVFFSSPVFLTPLYKSEVIIYPPSTNSNRMLIDRDARFGSDKEIDEQIQLLRSAIVRDSIVRKYKLYSHYGVDSTAVDKRYRLYKIYDDRIKVDRTRYNSISASVLDENPQTAAAMANDIVRLGDKLRSDIIRGKLKEAFDALAKTLFDLSLDIDQTASQINKSFEKPAVSGAAFYKRNSLEQLKEQLDLKELMQKARESNNLSQLQLLYYYESKLQQMSTIQLSYDQALVGLGNQVPGSFIISPAEVSDKKSYPIRWMIFLAATIAAFLVGCLAAIFIERYKGIVAAITK